MVRGCVRGPGAAAVDVGGSGVVVEGRRRGRPRREKARNHGVSRQQTTYPGSSLSHSTSASTSAPCAMASSRTPFFPCKWDWCTDVFSTRIALTEHLREHLRDYNPIKRRDYVAALRADGRSMPTSTLPMLPSLASPDMHPSLQSDARSPHAPCIEPSKLHDHTRSSSPFQSTTPPRPIRRSRRMTFSELSSPDRTPTPPIPPLPDSPSTDVLISQLAEPREREYSRNSVSPRPARSRTARMRTSPIRPSIRLSRATNAAVTMSALPYSRFSSTSRSMSPEPVLRRRPGAFHASAALTGVLSVHESPNFPGAINSPEDDSTQAFLRQLNTQPPLDHSNYDASLW
ncbi:hypothetical protein BOTBODRAFT_149760 [Botryobasidium botryosum FD-172 SS1]|uniref:C2H2-type domain-containing protein n=1 Tax=Botryobasidium botryosum (strain FD-172 SS1) TaxID=930990 RepID=A0A067M3Q1_BOTB1|nr:hypothetical protein BOTBODRAFT_149760 [Botryobasidium botryosum FD-172 SS1]